MNVTTMAVTQKSTDHWVSLSQVKRELNQVPRAKSSDGFSSLVVVWGLGTSDSPLLIGLDYLLDQGVAHDIFVIEVDETDTFYVLEDGNNLNQAR